MRVEKGTKGMPIDIFAVIEGPYDEMLRGATCLIEDVYFPKSGGVCVRREESLTSSGAR
jgi:hypothetical protein